MYFALDELMLNTLLRIFCLPVRKHLLPLQLAANARVLAVQNEKKTAAEDVPAKEEMFFVAAAANVAQVLNLAGTGYVYSLKLPEAIIRPIKF